MNSSAAPRGVLARIPGWEHAEAAELSGGMTNRTWLVSNQNARGVLKVDRSPRSAPYNPRDAEAQIQSRAADEDLAPRVLYADATTYLTEYVEGRVWDRNAFDDDDDLLRLARALRRLHSLPLTGRSFDAKDAAHQYRRDLAGADPELAQRYVAVIDAMRRPHNLCCCHNDLVAGNIIATPGLRFLDWEYACDNDPMFDLATIVAHHGLSTARASLLLDAYFDGDGARWQAQLARQERLYEALLWLWQASRGRSARPQNRD